MKYQTLSLALAALLALTPAYAQSSRGNRATRGAAPAAAEEAAPKSGVRFVICAPNGGKLPSPLYYQSGKDEYKQARISGRIPTQRIKPIAGVISFYDQDPAPAAAEGADKKKGAAAAAKKPEIKPVMTINVPASAGSKSVCIVVPGETPAKAQTFFLNESDFPSKGVHLINLSPRPVTVSVSAKGDFTDAREKKVAPFRRDEGISDKNSWHFTGGSHGEQVAFRITHRQTKKVGGKEVAQEVPLKMGKFLVSDRQSQINVVVKAGEDNLKLMSIQVAND